MRLLLLSVSVFSTGCGDVSHVRTPRPVLSSMPNHNIRVPKADVVCAADIGQAVCSPCVAESRVDVPATDERCPPIDCSALSGFELIKSGREERCVEFIYGGQRRACESAGQCATSAHTSVCPPVETREILKVVAPCSTIVGCGSDSLSIRWAAHGTQCPTGSCV